MSPVSKCNLFAVFVVLINWHYLVTTTMSSGSTKIASSLSISGAGLMIFFTSILIIVLARRLYYRLRALLAKGVAISNDDKWINWTPCILLLPVFIRVSTFATESTGTRTNVTDLGYGTDSPALLFSICATVIILYQIDWNMSECGRKQNNG